MMAPQIRIGLPLSQLMRGILAVERNDDRTISDIALDSRDAGPGTCFFALEGTRTSGLDYAREAADRGAAAIVTEIPAPGLRLTVPVLTVSKLRDHLGEIARRFFDDPSTAVRVFAVTGTNGKSTVAHITAQAVQKLGSSCGYIGTLGAGRLDQLTPMGMTTPDVITLNRWLARLYQEGVEVVTLEASSHALEQDRLSGLTLDAAAFTNLGHDHLDYHGDIEAYARSKERLFEHPDLSTAIVNIDDTLGAKIAASIGAGIDLWTCSTRRHEARDRARLSAAGIEASVEGLRFTLLHANSSYRIESSLTGRFNAENLTIVAAYLLSLGHAPERVCEALSGVRRVPGRMESCGTTAAGARVFVDYAHSPDSLLAALTALREVDPRRVILVFGCGGERDRSKRPLMGKIAEAHADVVIMTSDNPRFEQNPAIVAEMAMGMRAPEKATTIHDRAEAITAAIDTASTGDIVLIAGKGHESVQEHDGLRTPFNDRTVIEQALRGNR